MISWRCQKATLLIIDIFFALFAINISYFIFQRGSLFGIQNNFLEMMIFTVIVIGVFTYTDLYNYAVFLNRFRYIYRTTKGILYSFIIYLIWAWIFKSYHSLHTMFPLILFIVFSGLVYFSRIALLPLLSFVFPRKDVIIYAPEGEYKDIKNWLDNHRESCMNIKKIVTEYDEISKYNGKSVPVIISSVTGNWERLINMLLSFKGKIPVMLYSPLLSGINDVDYWAYIDNDRVPVVPFSWSGNSGFYKTIKRITDIFGSSLALFIFSPVMIISALIIKLTSEGPVFFKQHRLGRNEKRFEMLKFRSMYQNNNYESHKEYIKDFINGSNGKQSVYKMTDDNRVTPIGNILRKTSVDEFPQFFNVLKGDLSLVGPRPPIDYETEHYKEWHKDRLSVKQGLTGVWQNFGRSQLPFDKSCFLDIFYAENRSFWMDLHLIILTLPAIVFGKGAY